MDNHQHQTELTRVALHYLLSDMRRDLVEVELPDGVRATPQMVESIIQSLDNRPPLSTSDSDLGHPAMSLATG